MERAEANWPFPFPACMLGAGLDASTGIEIFIPAIVRTILSRGSWRGEPFSLKAMWLTFL
jgi:hypothetical protein